MCVAFPGQVLEIADGMAVVDIDAQTRRASTALVPETTVGDWVVVAAGAILRVLDPDEARETRALLNDALADRTVDAIDDQTATGGSPAS